MRQHTCKHLKTHTYTPTQTHKHKHTIFGEHWSLLLICLSPFVLNLATFILQLAFMFNSSFVNCRKCFIFYSSFFHFWFIFYYSFFLLSSFYFDPAIGIHVRFLICQGVQDQSRRIKVARMRNRKCIKDEKMRNRKWIIFYSSFFFGFVPRVASTKKVTNSVLIWSCDWLLFWIVLEFVSVLVWISSCSWLFFVIFPLLLFLYHEQHVHTVGQENPAHSRIVIGSFCIFRTFSVLNFVFIWFFLFFRTASSTSTDIDKKFLSKSRYNRLITRLWKEL